MNNMCTEIHAKTNTGDKNGINYIMQYSNNALSIHYQCILCTRPDDDDVHAGDVYGQSPPVHEARHVDAREQNTPTPKLAKVSQS